MPQSPSITASVSAAFLELTTAAEVLNGVSDALGKSVSEIDEGLRKLNLGIETWVAFVHHTDDFDGSTYHAEEIGYSKQGSKWGVSLRVRDGDIRNDTEASEAWLFNEAPRSLRLKAIDKLPDLVKKLSLAATELTKELQSKLADTQAIAAAVNPRATPPTVRQAMMAGLGSIVGSEHGKFVTMTTDPTDGTTVSRVAGGKK